MMIFLPPVQANISTRPGYLYIIGAGWNARNLFSLTGHHPTFELGHAGRRLSNDNDDDDENKLPVIKQLAVCSAVASAKN